MTHTPGPWRITQTEDSHIIDHVTGKYSDLVVSVPKMLGGFEASEANARLIAAAPDLLEALCKAEAAMLLADWNVPEFVADGRVTQRQHDACNVARAAIAKATGQS